jgi:hypothetical protein
MATAPQPEVQNQPVTPPPAVTTVNTSPGKTNSFRGPLRYEIETESSQLEAGAPFNIFVRITNPYDVEVTVLSVATLLPAEFKDPKSTTSGMVEWMKTITTEAVTTRPIMATAVPVVYNGEQKQEKPGIEEGPIALEPGNTALKRFEVRTRRTILFTPEVYTFHIEIHYQINGRSNFDAVKQQFKIGAPLKALVWGSFWGALAGASLHGLRDHMNDLHALWGLSSVATPVAGILIGAVLVVAFARKKDAQPFITIEDFYGGCFVGFVAGFVGFPILDSILPK